MHTKINIVIFQSVCIYLCRFRQSSQKSSHFTHSINTLEPNAWMAKVRSYMYLVYVHVWYASYHCGALHNLIVTHIVYTLCSLVPAQVAARGHGLQKIGTISPHERWIDSTCKNQHDSALRLMLLIYRTVYLYMCPYTLSCELRLEEVVATSMRTTEGLTTEVHIIHTFPPLQH